MDGYIIDISEIIPEMVTIRETAKRTGLSYDDIRKLALAGKIVHIRIGRKYFINFGKFCKFLNTQHGTVI